MSGFLQSRPCGVDETFPQRTGPRSVLLLRLHRHLLGVCCLEPDPRPTIIAEPFLQAARACASDRPFIDLWSPRLDPPGVFKGSSHRSTRRDLQVLLHLPAKPSLVTSSRPDGADATLNTAGR